MFENNLLNINWIIKDEVTEKIKTIYFYKRSVIVFTISFIYFKDEILFIKKKKKNIQINQKYLINIILL